MSADPFVDRLCTLLFEEKVSKVLLDRTEEFCKSLLHLKTGSWLINYVEYEKEIWIEFWGHDPRKLTFFISETNPQVTCMKVWGVDMDEEMEYIVVGVKESIDMLFDWVNSKENNGL